jgi:hypothetical protein
LIPISAFLPQVLPFWSWWKAVFSLSKSWM